MLGLNGAGKSSLLRIMAGEDPDFIGEAFLGKGYTVGFLPQEPALDPAKTVLENVEEGVAEQGRHRATAGTRSAPASPSRWKTTR